MIKPIELTQEHTSKLIEMCNYFYPEYNVKINDYQIDIDRNHYCPIFVDFCLDRTEAPFDIYSIHWFEFCCIHLFNKILESENQHKIEAYFESHFHFKENPIDYLYENYLIIK